MSREKGNYYDIGWVTVMNVENKELLTTAAASNTEAVLSFLNFIPLRVMTSTSRTMDIFYYLANLRYFNLFKNVAL